MTDLGAISQLSAVAISIACAFVSHSTKKTIVRRVSLTVLLIASLVLLGTVLYALESVWIKALVVLVGVLYSAFIAWELIATRQTMSISRMNKEMLRHTKNVATSSIIRIFGGDVDFFGEYQLGSAGAEIASNDSFQQLKKLGDERDVRVEILCRRPKTAPDMLRIGYLAENLPDVKFAFYTDGGIEDCPECELETICNMMGCAREDRLVNCCKLMRGRCPDLRFRGRMLTMNNSGNYVLVANWIEHDKTYERLIVFEPDSRESRFYMDLWEALWQNSESYGPRNNAILDECKTKLRAMASM